MEVNITLTPNAPIVTTVLVSTWSKNPVPILYADLVTKKNANLLAPEQVYKITDFRSSMLVPGQTYSNISKRGDDIPAHDLLIKASSKNTFYPWVQDTEFPTDLVMYDITGAKGGAAYPSDGTQRGYIYYREWQDVSPSAPKTTSFTRGWDGRNAVVWIGAVNLSAMNGAAISHCTLSSSGFLYKNSSYVNVNVTPLDTDPYDAVTNTDGVKHHFMFGDARSWNTNAFTNNKFDTGRYSGQVPKIYWEYTGAYKDTYGSVNNSVFNFGAEGQIFIGKYASVYGAIFAKIATLRILTSPSQVTWLDAQAAGGVWYTGWTNIGSGYYSDFGGLVQDTRFGYDINVKIGSTISGSYTSKAAVGGTNANCCKIGYFANSDVYNDLTVFSNAFIPWNFRDARVKFLTALAMAEKELRFHDMICPTDGASESTYIEITEVNNVITHGPSNSMRAMHNLTTYPVVGTTLTLKNIYAGVHELTTAVGANTIDTLAGTYCESLILKNASGEDLILDDSGHFVFSNGYAAPITIPNGGAVALKRINSGWLVL
jgi:hypothetical protein